jgi:molybdopterin-biosynthesis enzyme MoeA-like protein
MAEKAQPDWTLTDARKRMATFPSPAQIIRADPSLWVPIVVVHENIHILPGIPQLFERLVKSLRPHIEETMAKKNIVSGQYHRREIASSMPEGIIAARLSTIQDQVAAQHVKIGSYPKSGVGPNGERVVVSIVGKDQAAVQDTAQLVANAIDGWTYVKKH